MNRLNLTIIALLLMVGVPYYWFMLDTSTPQSEPMPISMAQLRSLAAAPVQEAPRRIRFEHVAKQSVTGNRITAGVGLKSIELYTLSYMVEYADQAPILIGSGIASEDVARFGHDNFFPRAQARIASALSRAQMLVPLALTPEQLGGLRMLGQSEQAKALDAKLARQQQADSKLVPHRVAPGIVVIPAPKFQAGARMVYVKLASGREYLFAGNIARTYRAWSELRPPARFVTDIGKKEDRGAIMSWLLTLRKLKQEAPRLVIVSGNRIPKRGGLLHYFYESANIVR